MYDRLRLRSKRRDLARQGQDAVGGVGDLDAQSSEWGRRAIPLREQEGFASGLLEQRAEWLYNKSMVGKL